MSRIIYDLCGGSGSWSKPYADAGYDVRIIEYKNGDDVRLLESDPSAHGILAACPCTEFAVSGARWWAAKGVEPLLEGLSVADACLRFIHASKPAWWCLENPVGRLRRFIGPPVHSFNPCDYGDPYTKKTLLWGEFTMPPKSPVYPTEGSKMHLLPPGPERAALRSVTPAGFARAFFDANP